LVRPGGFDVRSDVLDFFVSAAISAFRRITEIQTDRPVQVPSPPVAAGVDFSLTENYHWRATADEDGHYSFAVAL
jgi:hypothetical protein